MASDRFIPPQQFETPAFTLRCYRIGDGKLLSAAVNASYDHLKTFMDWAKPLQTEAESVRLVQKFRRNYLQAREFTFGIFSTDGSQLLGGTGYHMREGPLLQGNAEIGMWIRGDQAGKGVGTSVLQALIRWGFTEWPWQRLSWRCAGKNHASRKVAVKASMQQEGVLRSQRLLADGTRDDTYCFAILRSEFENRS